MALQKLLLVVLLLGQAAGFHHSTAHPSPSTHPARYDVVYGATAAGVMAAIAAAREGASVLLIEPGRHLGGMLTGGLSHTDYGDRAVIGGMPLEFYERVARAYIKPIYFRRGPEPALGEKILGDWLKEAEVTTRFDGRVKSVTREGAAIRSIQLLDGSTYAAAVFVDAGYEGDLIKPKSGRQFLTLGGNPNGVFGQGNTVVVDDDVSRFVEREGNWYATEDPAAGRHAITFLLHELAEPSPVTYRPWLPRTGTYKVYGWWPKGAKLAPDVPLTVSHAGGTASLFLNQQRDGGGWVLLGTFPFAAGAGSSLTLSNQGAAGAVAADAFKFEWVK